MRFFALLLLLTSCAETQTRRPGDAGWACGKPLEPGQYCANFSATEALRNDPSALHAKAQCLSFYGAAVRSTELLCGYFEEIDSLTFWGEGKSSADLTAKGKFIHRKYERLARLREAELERALDTAGGRGATGSLEELDYDGKKDLEDELACETDAPHAPGLELIGLAAQTRRDEQATFDRLVKSLRLLGAATTLSPERPYKKLRLAMGFDKTAQPYEHARERIISNRLDEPALLAAGKAMVEPSPALETYYAQSLERAKDPNAPLPEPGKAVPGRSLASVRCPR